MASLSPLALLTPAWSSSSNYTTWPSSPLPIALPAWFPNPSAFLTLSYPSPVRTHNFFPDSQHYGKGYQDIAYVFGWTIVLTLLRELTMRGVFAPFMRWWLDRLDQRRAAAKLKSKPSSKSALPSSEKASGLDHDAGDSGDGQRYHADGKNGQVARRNVGSKSKKPVSDRQTTPVTASKKVRRRQDKQRERRVTRFAEQGWSFIYVAVFWPIGMTIHAASPYYPFNLDHIWIGYPEQHTYLPGLVKFYYLTQLAFWFNQLLSLQIEERRKDYTQMLTHHIVTITLMVASYAMNCTRCGCIILILMDFCDILLPLAKMLLYMSVPVVPDVMFCTFLVSWLVSRQFLFLGVIISVLKDAPRLLDLRWEPQAGAFLTQRGLYAFSAFLGTLLVLMCIWFVMICKVAYGVLMGKPAEDTRSDDEGDDQEE